MHTYLSFIFKILAASVFFVTIFKSCQNSTAIKGNEKAE